MSDKENELYNEDIEQQDNADQGSSRHDVYSKSKSTVAVSNGGDTSLLLEGDDDDYEDDYEDDDYADEDDQDVAPKSNPQPWASALGNNGSDDSYDDQDDESDDQYDDDVDGNSVDYDDQDSDADDYYNRSSDDNDYDERHDDNDYDNRHSDEDDSYADSYDDSDEQGASADQVSAYDGSSDYDDAVSAVNAEADEDAEPTQTAQEATDAADKAEIVLFDSLDLSPDVLKAIKHEGFEQPTPIQLRSIPVVLSGRDMIGQAQTGTGKTAAFALPILSKLPKRQKKIYALILEPTRELALQVAESFSRFAHFIDNFRVLPVYGGASYENQIRSLRHGAQVVVATPGRLIDLIEKGCLDFSDLKYVVIDEADEMLRMGFIDDVDWILEQVPREHQTALFSATMPPVIRRIAKAHLVEPEEIHIESHTTTATTVRQRYWVVSGVHKIDAMTRMLEVESYEAVLVFVRTKTDAEDVANKLAGRGLACAALHGDIPQRQREKIVERLKKGSLDIIIATDVAARGLDVDRITHVFNYDIPYDAESYVHRIGRTGRAGRTGEAILFVSPRERRALRQIERVTRQRIEPMRMPTVADVNKRRLENFRNQILETIDAGGLDDYLEVISDLLTDDAIEPEILAAALAKLAQRDGSLLLDDTAPEPKMRSFDDRGDRGERGGRERRHGGPSAEPVPLRDFPDMKMVRYRLAVGRRDSVKPGQIVGAIANEANIESKFIGEISIFDTFATVDLPDGMPRETMDILARARVCGRSLDLREYTSEPPARSGRRDRGDRFDRYDRRDRFDRGDRRDRGDRGDRGDRRDRGDRYERRDRFDRDDRFNRRDRFDRRRSDSDNYSDNRFGRNDSGFNDADFSYMDEGEYRHEKGDINGNSVNYRPGRSGDDRGNRRDRGFGDHGSRRGNSRPRPNFGGSRRGF